mgnify:CR=1 FL=1
MDKCHGCRLSDDKKTLICAACAGQRGHDAVSIKLEGCHFIYSEQGALRCFNYGHNVGEDELGHEVTSNDEMDGDHIVNKIDPTVQSVGSSATYGDMPAYSASGKHRLPTIHPPSSMPEGSYMETCHGCRLNNAKTILTCSSCAGQKVHGEKSIEIGDCHFIYNEMGNLRCFSYGNEHGERVQNRGELSSYNGKHEQL